MSYSGYDVKWGVQASQAKDKSFAFVNVRINFSEKNKGIPKKTLN